MRVRMFVKSLRLTGEAAISEDHELEIGRYNEFYLPSIRQDHDAWIVITDDQGEETVLHLKR